MRRRAVFPSTECAAPAESQATATGKPLRRTAALPVAATFQCCCAGRMHATPAGRLGSCFQVAPSTCIKKHVGMLCRTTSVAVVACIAAASASCKHQFNSSARLCLNKRSGRSSGRVCVTRREAKATMRRRSRSVAHRSHSSLTRTSHERGVPDWISRCHATASPLHRSCWQSHWPLFGHQLPACSVG